MYTLTPITGVNVRSGPGMEYDIAYRLPPNQAVEWFDKKRDSINKIWYQTAIGWVCGDYVTLAEDAQGEILRLNLFAGEDAGGEMYQMTKRAGDSAAAAGSKVWDMVDSAGNVIKTTTQPAISTAENVASRAIDAASRAAGAAGDIASSVAKGVGETFNGAANTIKGGIATVGGGFGGAIQGMQDSEAGQSIGRVVTNARETLGGLADSAIGMADSVVGGISSMLGGDMESGYSDNLLKRRMFGVPYQFLPTTDARADSGDDVALGVSFKQMMMESPRLMVIPGKPLFLPDLDNEQRTTYLEAMNQMVRDMGTLPSAINDFMAEGGPKKLEMKFFSFKQDFTEFCRYLNAMCWVTAIMMGIGDEIVPGTNKQYKNFDWSTFTLAHSMDARDAGANNFGLNATIEGIAEASKDSAEALWKEAEAAYRGYVHGEETDEGPGFKAVMSNLSIEKYYTEFYIDPSVSFSESHTNNLRPSMLAEIANKGSDLANELMFFLDTTRIGQNIAGSSEAVSKALHDTLGTGIGGPAGQFVNRFLKGASSVFSGAVLQFPEIWSGYNFSRNYNIEINLKAAYGDKQSIFIDEFVPMWFWNCLTMPRQHSPNAYRSPFLVRCNIPGIVNTDMGVVTSLTRTIGETSARSVEGYPLEMKLSINITELISEISISRINGASYEDAYNFLWNTALMDYIASMSACDFRQSDYMKKATVAKALAENAMGDLFDHPVDAFAESVREAIYKIFNGR